jgi:hypothetical protein
MFDTLIILFFYLFVVFDYVAHYIAHSTLIILTFYLFVVFYYVAHYVAHFTLIILSFYLFVVFDYVAHYVAHFTLIILIFYLFVVFYYVAHYVAYFMIEIAFLVNNLIIVVLREIRRYQKSIDFLIASTSFSRLMKKIFHDNSDIVNKIQTSTLIVLRNVSFRRWMILKNYLLKLMCFSY